MYWTKLPRILQVWSKPGRGCMREEEGEKSPWRSKIHGSPWPGCRGRSGKFVPSAGAVIVSSAIEAGIRGRPSRWRSLGRLKADGGSRSHAIRFSQPGAVAYTARNT